MSAECSSCSARWTRRTCARSCSARSATVYGEPERLPIDEQHPTRAENPYGQTKLICENILSDLTRAERGWRVSLLRYFNPVGAHASGLIGEDPTGVPNNLMPLIARAASGQTERLEVYGTDYPTADGTAVRDYIHVADLAEGHVAALDKLAVGDPLQVYNLGTGQGTSVFELIAAFEQATGVSVPHAISARRPGDVPALCAAPRKAERELGWRARRGLSEMCADSWRFTTQEAARRTEAGKAAVFGLEQPPRPRPRLLKRRKRRPTRSSVLQVVDQVNVLHPPADGGGGADPVVNAEHAEGGVDVNLDRPLGDVEHLADLAVGMPQSEQAKDFALPLGEFLVDEAMSFGRRGRDVRLRPRGRTAGRSSRS